MPLPGLLTFYSTYTYSYVTIDIPSMRISSVMPRRMLLSECPNTKCSCLWTYCHLAYIMLKSVWGKNINTCSKVLIYLQFLCLCNRISWNRSSRSPSDVRTSHTFIYTNSLSRTGQFIPNRPAINHILTNIIPKKLRDYLFT